MMEDPPSVPEYRVREREEGGHESLSDERLFRLFVEGTDDLLTETDRDGIFTFVNHAAKKVLGLAPEECVGRSAFEFVHPEDRDRTRLAFEGWIRERARRATLENRQVSRTGDVRDMLWTINLHYDAGGELSSINSIARDITERKRLEAEFRSSEARYRSVVEDQTEFIVRWLPDTTRTFVNDAYCRFFQQPREELVGTSFMPLVAEEDRKALREMIASITPRNPILTEEHRVVLPDGSRGWQQWTTRGIFDDAGKLVELLSVGRDITDRRRAEESVRALLNASTETALLVNPEGRVLAANQVMADRVGMSLEALVGKEIHQYLPPELVRPRMERGEEVIRSGKPVRFQDVREGRLYDTNIYPVFDESDRVAALAIYSADITEARTAQEMYRLLAENASDVIWTMDLDFNHTFVSPSVTRQRGFTVEEAMALPLEASLAPASANVARKVLSEGIAQLRRDGEAAPDDTLELEVKRKDGSTFWAEVKISPMRDARGTVTGLMGVTRDIDKRKRAEAALRRSEGLFHQAFHASPLSMTILDVDEWRIIDVNEVLTRGLGYSPEELKGKTLDELNLFRDPDAAAALLQRLVRNGQVRDAELWIVTKSGEQRLMSYSAQLMELGGERIALVTGQDVTDRKAAERALRDSEIRYRTLFESASDALFLVEGDRFLDCNPRTLELFGCSRVQIIGETPYRFSPPTQPDGRDSKAKAREKIETALAGQPQLFDWRHQRMDGTAFDASVMLSRLDLGGRALLLAVVRDISEQQRIRSELRRLSSAVEQSRDGIAILSPSFTYEYVNPAYEQIVGLSREKILGRHMRDIHAGQVDPVVVEEVIATLGQKRSWKNRLRRLRPDGKDLETELLVFPLFDEAGALVNYVAAHRDITEQTKLETHLVQAQKMEAIGTLAGGIAHDFNNILSAITGFTELSLARAPKNPDLKNYLRRVLEASGRASGLVKQILAFSRQAHQEKKPVQVKLIVAEALKLLRASLPTTIEIRQDLRSPTAVIADPTQLHQIMMNLCTNAGLAMRKEGGLLEVRLDDVDLDPAFAARHVGLEPGPFVRLQVRDTGCGMTPEVMARIFEPFYTTRGKDEGTGMGLSVVHGIVKDCGGTVTVISEVGKGTRFEVYLPAITAPASPAVEEVVAVPTGTERVLFVDDEQTQVSLAKQMLEYLGYRVTALTSSAEALDAFRAAPQAFDLVITDMTMPGMTGDALARKLLLLRPDLPIILCTGYSELISEAKVKAMGIRGFALKPVVMRQLGKLIREVLDGKK